MLSQTSILLHYSTKRKSENDTTAVRPLPALRLLPSCEGIIPSPTSGQIREQLVYFERYAIPPTQANSTYLLKTLPGGSNYPQLFAVSCTNAGIQRYHKMSRGLRCNECEKTRKMNGKAIRQRIKNKFERYHEVEDILLVAHIVQSQILRLTTFTKLPNDCLNDCGRCLKEQALSHGKYYQRVHKLNKQLQHIPSAHVSPLA